ncbi:M56 family metallopeptidase [Sedimentibacter hydroxybenzoicus]|uniref:M56 family metallopeptidase n=1 Tax=Sedimentibacter hydroxybenzoicus TaxID=29345 RepID=UPI0015C67120|nr:M56 family metallopeptidase [Sedimentibacter hydroxybenzoicus]
MDFFTSEIFEIHVYELLIGVWIAGSIYYLQKYIRQLIFLNKLANSLIETQDKRIISCMNKITTESSKNTKVKIVQSNEISVPMIAGFFKPVIYLPYTYFSDMDLKNILMHEWIHFLHKDAWTKLFVSLISVVFWWNPFVHILKNELSQTLELRCDLSIISRMEHENHLIYLESIIKVIKYANNKSLHKLRSAVGSTQLVSINGNENMTQRFELILNYLSCKKRNMLSSVILCAFILLSVVASYGFVVQPLYHPTVEKTHEESFAIFPENSYLVLNEDGTYSLYIDNKYIGFIENRDDEQFSSLPVK